MGLSDGVVMRPSYEQAELVRYRIEHPEDGVLPDDVLTETFMFQRVILRYRIEDVGRVARRELRRDLARLDEFMDRHRDHALLRWWWS